MKKLLGFGVLLASTATLSACNGLPKCMDYLDECNQGGAYTEERTVKSNKKVMMEAPAPVVAAPAPAPVAAPAPVMVKPAPVVNDTPVMRSAEPQFTQISK